MTRDCDGVSPRFESHTGRIAKTLKNENFAVFFNFQINQIRNCSVQIKKIRRDIWLSNEKKYICRTLNR